MGAFADNGTPARRADDVKRRLRDPVALATALGLPHRREGRSFYVLCPRHTESGPSCSLCVYDDGIGVCCFGCDLRGTSLDLIAEVHGLEVRGRDFVRVVELAEEIAGIARPSAAPVWSPPRKTRTPPTPAALAALWEDCVEVTENPDVGAWLVSRGIDPGDIVDRQLARALSSSGILPGFARTGLGDWRDTGHLCVIPTFDAAGQLAGLRARYVGTGDAPRAKELAPYGGCSVSVR